MTKGLGDAKRKFKATKKLGVYFKPKTCEEMNKGQKLEARIAEGAKAIEKDKNMFDEKRKAKRERDLENEPAVAFREWQDEHFRLIRVDNHARAASARGETARGGPSARQYGD